jgi:hypothetical protein
MPPKGEIAIPTRKKYTRAARCQLLRKVAVPCNERGYPNPSIETGACSSGRPADVLSLIQDGSRASFISDVPNLNYPYE